MGKNTEIPPSEACFCGTSALKVTVKTEDLTAWKCSECGSYRVRHHRRSADRPWSAENIDERFLSALFQRRVTQARLISRTWFREGYQRVLDYGCGQGVFLREVDEAHADIVGCDLDPQNFTAAKEKFRQLPSPWYVPSKSEVGERDAVVLLDVIEHAEDPCDLLSRIQSQLDARVFILKTPNLRGPISLGSLLLARFGKPGIFESLVLVGDPAPHLWVMTLRGMDRMMGRLGYRRNSSLSLAEVGSELRDRVRNERLRSMIPRWVWSLMGAGLEWGSRLWPETICVRYVKTRLT